MAKLSLLEMVQDIGASIGSDEIDQLDENTESLDIVRFLRMAYRQIIDRLQWEYLQNRTVTMAERVGGDLQINRLPFPANFQKLSDPICVRYRDPKDGRNQLFKDLHYKSPSEFLRYVQQPNENDANISTVLNPDGVAMLIRNDVAPTYYTSFDEEHLWFDAFDETRGSGVLGSDCTIIADMKPAEPDWTDPAATLPLPERFETLLINEALLIASVRLRQVADPTAASESRRQYNNLRENGHGVVKDKQEINYGRRRR